MQISQKGMDFIKSFEGLELHAYKDAVGVWTIGYGHTGNVRSGQALTQAQAEALLKADLQRFVEGVNEMVKVPLNQNQFDALVSFVFNLGNEALKSSDLLTFVNRGNFTSASKEFGRWIHAGGNVLQGLVRRREAERVLFVTPAKTASKPVTKPAVKVAKASKPNLKGDMQTTSLIDYLTSIKADPSVGNRKKLALKYGVKNYVGTADQNTQLLNKLRK